MKINIYIYIFIIILYFNFINSKPLSEIHHIISATLNGTSAFAALESIQPNEKYIYFTFDFKFHHSAVATYKNLAKFLISSDFELKGHKKEKMKYGFVEKNWDEIKTEDDIQNIKWKTIKILHKEKPYNDINYYVKIKRRKEKMNTLILRIPLNGRNEGSINIENILEFPDFDQNELNEL